MVDSMNLDDSISSISEYSEGVHRRHRSERRHTRMQKSTQSRVSSSSQSKAASLSQSRATSISESRGGQSSRSRGGGASSQSRGGQASRTRVGEGGLVAFCSQVVQKAPRRAVRIFEKNDADKDGLLTVEETALAFKQLDVPLSTTQLMSLLCTPHITRGGKLLYSALLDLDAAAATKPSKAVARTSRVEASRSLRSDSAFAIDSSLDYSYASTDSQLWPADWQQMSTKAKNVLRRRQRGVTSPYA